MAHQCPLPPTGVSTSDSNRHDPHVLPDFVLTPCIICLARTPPCIKDYSSNFRVQSDREDLRIFYWCGSRCGPCSHPALSPPHGPARSRWVFPPVPGMTIHQTLRNTHFYTISSAVSLCSLPPLAPLYSREPFSYPFDLATFPVQLSQTPFSVCKAWYSRPDNVVPQHSFPFGSFDPARPALFLRSICPHPCAPSRGLHVGGSPRP